MLRAGTTGPNPLVLAGLSEDNIRMLRNNRPIKAPLSTFSPGMPGQLCIFYGKTHAEMEAMLKNEGLISESAEQSFDQRLEQEEEAKRRHPHILICTVGLPRSGKTTWAREQCYPIVNPDSIRLGLHGQRFIEQAEPFVWATAKLMVRSLFLAGHSVVIVDATNNTKKRRSDWFSSDWQTFFKVIDTAKHVCVERADSAGDAAIIPVIERMAASAEPLDETCKLWS